jgi:phosphotransferase system HPr (HPr) family protein
MKEISYTIKNRLGINPRTAQGFTKLMNGFTGAIKVHRGGDVCNGKDLYDLLNLQVRMNDIITVNATGINEEEAIIAAADFLKKYL